MSWFVFCYCDEHHDQKQFCGWSDWFTRPSHDPSLRENRAGTQPEAKTRIIEEYSLLVHTQLPFSSLPPSLSPSCSSPARSSATFLIQPKTTHLRMISQQAGTSFYQLSIKKMATDTPTKSQSEGGNISTEVPFIQMCQVDSEDSHCTWADYPRPPPL